MEFTGAIRYLIGLFRYDQLSTVLGQPGQGNYNAANTFMESFCQYRHSLGLPASVLNICPIEGVGFDHRIVGLVEEREAFARLTGDGKAVVANHVACEA